ncbi:DUF1127 domain-containing protein [Rhodobacteraceae bacterium W635]|uniref:DUF1127 domain-containing protein n=1 Tax=Nioella halotolerans TaxID=2303578 RepID=UPI000E3C61FE|nr:DUF1127 domain-containing protein [Rhodobacteraceae bacterium W635]
MATTLSHASLPASRRHSLTAFARAAITAWRQRRALERLDVHARRDLGLTEADIAREARRPAWDVPQAWLL